MLRNSKTLVLVFALALGMCGLGFAHEQEGPRGARQQGYGQGYRDGFDHGRQDRSYNATYDFQSPDYRRADHGYDRDMGDRGQFRDGYREGYRGGYDDGYYGRAGRFDRIYAGDRDDAYRRGGDDEHDDHYGRRGYGYSDVAYDIGYRDGLEAARSDWRKHKDYRPEKHDNYEDASHGYHDSYGPKNAYKAQYRQGFLRGYQEAYTRPY